MLGIHCPYNWVWKGETTSRSDFEEKRKCVSQTSLTPSCLRRGTDEDRNPRWCRVGKLYLWLRCHHQNTFCNMMGRDENNFNVSLVVRDKLTSYRQCPSTTFEEEEEKKRELNRRCPPTIQKKRLLCRVGELSYCYQKLKRTLPQRDESKNNNDIYHHNCHGYNNLLLNK